MQPSPDVAGPEAAEALSSLRAVTRQSAHDLNNLLLVIVAFAEPEIAPLGRPSESDLTPIEDTVERCAAITRRLLAECREPAPDAPAEQGHVL
jgi:signal transduction histidine kinase